MSENYLNTYYQPPPADERIITDVWESNFEEEFRKLKTAAKKYHIIAIVKRKYKKNNKI